MMYFDDFDDHATDALAALEREVMPCVHNIRAYDETIDDHVRELDRLAPGVGPYIEYRDDLASLLWERQKDYDHGMNARDTFLEELRSTIQSLEDLYDTINDTFEAEFEYPEECTVSISDYDI